MEIKKAIDMDSNISEKIGELYVEAFYEDGLKFFSKDKTNLIKTFTEVFILDYIYLAIIDNEIAGMIACMGKGPFCINYKKRIFIKHLGIFKGLLAFFSYTKYKKRCLELDDETALVEFVATSTEFRKMGVASSLIKHLLSFPEYKNYLIEVADTNSNAFELYKKLGFKELYRKKFIPKSGINYWIQMKYSKV